MFFKITKFLFGENLAICIFGIRCDSEEKFMTSLAEHMDKRIKRMEAITEQKDKQPRK